MENDDFMLSGYRALELGGEGIMYCGKILADLGVDVIKVEKPGGDPARQRGPFYHDVPDSERSLPWFAYNTNKKSITLNLETATGQELFKKLVATSDFVIESFQPGYLDRLGLGYTALAEVDPRLVMGAVTPFGQEGPYRNNKGSDLICMAMGGSVYLVGDADRPPVRIGGFPQAYLLASLMATSGLLIAHCYRELTGKGQFVDTSVQEAVTWMLGNACITFELLGKCLRRAGPRRGGLYSRVVQRMVWPCKDGSVVFNLGGGKAFAKSSRNLAELINREGLDDGFLKGLDWEALDLATASQESIDVIESYIARFFMSHSKMEIYEMALQYGFLAAPMTSMKELVENPQLKARGYWQEVEHPELGDTIIYPMPFYHMSTGCRTSARAPLVGEHNYEIYTRELGLSTAQLVMLREAAII